MKGFNFKTVSDFDKHIATSIPNYEGLFSLCMAFAREYLSHDSVCVDIGCSTGRLLSEINSDIGCSLIGCDVVDMTKVSCDFKFVNEQAHLFLDGLDETPDLIFSLFTLQFMSKKQRDKTISSMSKHVSNGAVLIVAEKAIMNSPKIENIIHRQHIFSKLNSFTADEILEKDIQLSYSMKPKVINEIESELETIGEYHQIWQSYGFRAWLVTSR